ncbi:hypothetical protein JCM14469_25180 [Desulfatiferula olefinivorans]
MLAKHRQTLALLFLFGLFGWALVHLFTLRFDAGDIYPPYSTLRSDPLGCRAFHDALTDLGLSVSRHRASLSSLNASDPATVFFLGDQAGSGSIPEAQYQPLAAMLDAGGRVVVALFPVQSLGGPDEEGSDEPDPVSPDEPDPVPPEETDTETESKPAPDDESSPPPPRIRTVDLREIWGYAIEDRPWASDPDPSSLTAVFDDGSGPQTLPWYSTLVFTDLTPDWRILARRDGEPVVIERTLGRGTLVFCSDSYMMSNEGLSEDLHPAFLTALIGEHRRVIFDESHLGIHMQPGIATLIRKYDLEGLVCALALLALLFIWKNAVPLVPPADRPIRRGALSDRDQTSGLISLYKRHIPPGDLIRVCVAQWKRSGDGIRLFKGDRADTRHTLLSAADAVSTSEAGVKDPLSAYREIRRLLSQGKTP